MTKSKLPAKKPRKINAKLKLTPPPRTPKSEPGSRSPRPRGGEQTSAAANAPQTFALCGIIAGLTPGTAYWFDITLLTAITGDTAQVDSPVIAFVEVQ